MGNWEASLSRCDPNAELRGLNETPDVIDKPVRLYCWGGRGGRSVNTGCFVIRYGLNCEILCPNFLVLCDGAEFIVPYFRKENKKVCVLYHAPVSSVQLTLLVLLLGLILDRSVMESECASIFYCSQRTVVLCDPVCI